MEPKITKRQEKCNAVVKHTTPGENLNPKSPEAQSIIKKKPDKP
jgi:hypothetical protein